MFEIHFTAEVPEVQEDGTRALWGETVLGDHRERFLAPVDVWSRETYERQWSEAARRLLDTEARSAFFTAAFSFWWTMWREEDRIFVHEEFLTPERLERVTDRTRTPYELVGQRVKEDEDGAPVSEWELSVAEVREFLDRRAGFGGVSADPAQP